MTSSSTVQSAVPTALAQHCVNTIRALTMDAVQQANSGHPGMPMGMADVAYVLWTQFLKHNPADPAWPNRDRFVLSAGHGSLLLYSLLHLSGYDLSLDDLRQFRQFGSRTPGHPEYQHTPGVETTTGPLGQGFGNAVGLALAAKHLASRFNQPDYPVIDHYTYVVASDGDMMEGISHEAAALAGHLRLDRLIVFYDQNRVSIDGSTDLTMSEDVGQRFAAYGWQVQHIDGHDRAAIAAAIEQAQADNERPSLIVCRTHIAFGSPKMQGDAAAHGKPLGDEEITRTKQALGYPTEPPFYVADEVYAVMGRAREHGAQQQQAWETLVRNYRSQFPEQAQQWQALQAGSDHRSVAELLPTFEPNAKGMATRAASGEVINALAAHLPELIGGSADLHGSNNTLIDGSEPLQHESPTSRNLYYGVREHAMGAMMNGMALYGGLLPFGGTFLVFSDYLRPTIRLAAMMGLQVIYVLTHDSLGVGEDGPTHQPVEHLPSLRLIPNLYVVRPADATETTQAWRIAIERTDGPTALILSRQKLPVLAPREDHAAYGALAPAEGVLRGGYVLQSPDQADVILIASGSEVSLALDAARLLAQQNIAARVVSMPCMELFEQQEQTYRDAVLPPTITARVAIELASSLGWERYVGLQGRIIGVDRFGASGPAKEVLKAYGFTPEHVAEVATSLVRG